MMQLKLLHTNLLVSTPFFGVMLTLPLVLKKQGRGLWWAVNVPSSSLEEI